MVSAVTVMVELLKATFVPAADSPAGAAAELPLMSYQFTVTPVPSAIFAVIAANVVDPAVPAVMVPVLVPTDIDLTVAGAGRLIDELVVWVSPVASKASCAPVTAAVLVAPRPAKVATPTLAVAVGDPVRVHKPASFLDAVTTVALSFVQVLPKASFKVTLGCWANCPPFAAGAVISWVRVMDTATAGTGVMETLVVAGVLTSGMLNAML